MSLVSLKPCNSKLLRLELFQTKQKKANPGGNWGPGLSVSDCKPGQTLREESRSRWDLQVCVCSLVSSLWDGWADDLPVHCCSTVTWLKLLVRTLYQDAYVRKGFPLRKGIQERKGNLCGIHKIYAYEKNHASKCLLNVLISELLLSDMCGSVSGSKVMQGSFGVRGSGWSHFHSPIVYTMSYFPLPELKPLLLPFCWWSYLIYMWPWLWSQFSFTLIVFSNLPGTILLCWRQREASKLFIPLITSDVTIFLNVPGDDLSQEGWIWDG